MKNTVEPLLADTPNSGHLPYNGQCAMYQLRFPYILYFKNLPIADTPNSGHLRIADSFSGTKAVVTPLERKCIARIQIYLHATLLTRPFINYSSLLFPGSCHDIVQCLVPKLSQLVVRFQYQHRTKSRSNHISRTCVTSNLYERL